MNKEIQPKQSDKMFANAELFLGSVGFVSGIVSTAAIISRGKQHLMGAVEKVREYDPIAALIYITQEIGIPPQVVLGVIIAASAALVMDGMRRRYRNKSG